MPALRARMGIALALVSVTACSAPRAVVVTADSAAMSAAANGPAGDEAEPLSDEAAGAMLADRRAARERNPIVFAPSGATADAHAASYRASADRVAAQAVAMVAALERVMDARAARWRIEARLEQVTIVRSVARAFRDYTPPMVRSHVSTRSTIPGPDAARLAVTAECWAVPYALDAVRTARETSTRVPGVEAELEWLRTQDDAVLSRCVERQQRLRIAPYRPGELRSVD